MKNSIFRRVLLFVAIMTSLMAVCLTISFADSQDEASKSEPVQVTQSDSKQNDSVITEINPNKENASDSKESNTEISELENQNVSSDSNVEKKLEKPVSAQKSLASGSTAPLDIFEIIRLGAGDRYATSRAIADEFKKKLGADKFGCVILTCGDNFADAMSASSLGKANNAPILLVNNRDINSTIEYIKNNLDLNGKVYIVGGSDVVSGSLESLLQGYNVSRLAGDTRYETNFEVLKAIDKPKEIALCSGNSFPDSLSVSSTGKAIMLVNKRLTDYQRNFIKDITNIYIIGGSDVVSLEIENEVKSNSKCERISGDDRYETSYAVARRFFPGQKDNLVLASGDNFPDGLCGGNFSAVVLNTPLLLVNRNNYADANSYALQSNCFRYYIMGDAGVVSDEWVKYIHNEFRDYINKMELLGNPNITVSSANVIGVYMPKHMKPVVNCGPGLTATLAGFGKVQGKFSFIYIVSSSELGNYIISASNGVVNKSMQLRVIPKSYGDVYYSQSDYRWGGLRYGYYSFASTGCAPTAMAMAFQGIKGGTYLPYQIGSYLYNNTFEYNRVALGSSGKAIYYAANAYGFKRESLRSLAELENALKKGYIVIAYVGASKYASPSYTHAIRLRGYSDGWTMVYDPDNRYNNGWAGVRYIWEHQSTDPYDRFDGTMFQAIYD
jgi:hypothetical protein